MQNIIPTLELENGKIYVAPNPKGKTVRRSLELLEEYGERKVREEDVDALTQFLADLYGNQFGINDIYDGISRAHVLSIIFDRIQAIVKMFLAAAQERPGTGEGKPVTLKEALSSLYRSIIKLGWSLPEIDESDFFALLDLLIEPEDKCYIDDIF